MRCKNISFENTYLNIGLPTEIKNWNKKLYKKILVVQCAFHGIWFCLNHCNYKNIRHDQRQAQS